MDDRFPGLPRVQPTYAPEKLLQTTLGLHAVGIELFLERLRQDHPDWSQERVMQELAAWRRGRGLDGWGDGFRVRLV